MAVRHGYGKIAGTDALVFAYDTGDIRNSYRGEPTFNKAGGVHLGFNGGRWAKRTDYPQKGALPFKLLGDVYQLTSGNNYWGSASDFSPAYNTTYTLSYWYYLSTDSNLSQWYNAFFGVPSAGGSQYTTVSTKSNDTFSVIGTNTWRYGSVNITTSTAVQYYTYFRGTYTSGGPDNLPSGQIYIANFQLEENSHATQYTTGTRSSTQGLLDLTGNNTIDLSNVSFNSSARKVFDGTNDGIDLGAGHTTFTNKSFAVEAILYPNTSPPVQQVFFAAVGPVGGLQKNIHFRIYSSGAYRMGFFSNDLDTAAGVVTFGEYNHVVMQYDHSSDTSYIYVNGQLNVSGNQGPFTDSSAQIGIGYWPGSGQYFNGEIPVTKLYNRVLTADEVRNNYRHYKTRFDI